MSAPLRLAAGLLALAVASTTASSQITAYELEIDENASFVQVRGDVFGFNLVGDRQSSIGGMLDIRTDVPNPPFQGFIIDAGTIVQLDPLVAKIDNPIPFFPPLGTARVEDVVAGLTSRIIRTEIDGSFSNLRGGSVLVDSGLVTGDVLGEPIGPIDLTGSSGPVPLEGTLTQEGDEIVLEFPLELVFEDDLANITISGTIVARGPAL